MKIGLIGFGSVGQGLVTILRDKSVELKEKYGFSPVITAVVTRSRGTVMHSHGLSLEGLLTAIQAGGLAFYPDTDGLDRTITAQQVAASSHIDVLIEVSPTNLDTAQPALDLCHIALDHGKHVVLANKGPVALAYANLMTRAAQHKRRVLFEGTVMAGTPSIRLGMEALAGCTVSKVRGIINGTTNYMLTQMETGRTYADVLEEAQRLGYAESDPAGDVDGWDAAGKLLILSNALFGHAPKLANMLVTGIRGLTPMDIAQAAAEGMRWKLIAEASPNGASVQPVKIPLSHPLAGVGGTQNAVTFSTDLMGDITLVGAGAGSIQTGFAVLSDLLTLHRTTEQ
jgi:homoserine dehydrogenase